jgi:serine/threonine-protein kinase
LRVLRMAIATVGAFVDVLRHNRLLKPAQLDELASPRFTRCTTPKALANELLQRGWLTAYQINQLFRGRVRELNVGPFLLLERLGEGGLGVVFKARHRKQEYTAALKLIRKERLAAFEVARQLQRDLRTAAQVSHPNLLQLLAAGQGADSYYLALEYIPNFLDLARVIKLSGPLPIAQACEFVRQAALALQVAHERDLVHGDVKPANLLLTEPGRTKLLDLGLGCLKNGMSRGQVTAQVPEEEIPDLLDFRAPEQLADPEHVDSRADLYGLGCTFYFLVTGQPLWAEPTSGAKGTPLHDAEPWPIERLRRDMPAGLARVVRKLMAARPEDRYQTAAEVVATLAVGWQQADVVESAPRPQAIVAEAVAPVPPPPAAEPSPVAEANHEQLAAGEAPPPAKPEEEEVELAGAGPRRVDPDDWVRTADTLTLQRSASAPDPYSADEDRSRVAQPEEEPLAAAAGSQEEEVDLAGAGRRRVAPDDWIHTADTMTLPHSASAPDPFSGGEGQSPAAPPGAEQVGAAAAAAPMAGPGEEEVELAGAGPRRVDLDDWMRTADTLTLQRSASAPGASPAAEDQRRAPKTAADLPAVPALRTPGSDPSGWVLPTDTATLHDAPKAVPTSGEGAATRSVSQPPAAPVAPYPTGNSSSANPSVPTVTVTVNLPASPPSAPPPPAVPTLSWKMWALAAVMMVVGVGAMGAALVIHGKKGQPPPAAADDPGEVVLDCADLDRSLPLGDQVQVILKRVGEPDTALSRSEAKARVRAGQYLVQLDWQGPAGLRVEPSAVAVTTGGLEHIRIRGLPLSPSALVSRPASLPDVSTWTIALRDAREAVADKSARPAPCLAWAGDSLSVAVGSTDGQVTLWNLKDAKLVSSLKHPAPVTALAWSPNGRILAAACAGEPLWLWEIDTGRSSRTAGPLHGIRSLAWSPDSQILASGGDDHMVQLWNAKGQPLRRLEGHTQAVVALAWSFDGTTLASGSADQSVRLWEVETKKQAGKLLHTLPHEGTVTALAWSRDDKALATGSADRTLRLWETATGKLLRTCAGSAETIHTLAWLPDGKGLTSQSTDGTLRVWDMAGGQLTCTRRGVDPGILSPSGRLLASGSPAYTARFWDSLAGQPYGTVVRLPKGPLFLAADGNYRGPAGIEEAIVYQTDRGEKYSPADFTQKYGWKNDPKRVHLIGN